MRRILILVLAGAMLSGSLLAQKRKVTSGILALDGGDPIKAIEKIEEGIADKSNFEGRKGKHLAKGYYYLAKAYLTAATDSTVDASQYQAPLKKAADYYVSAMDHPDKKVIEGNAVLDNLEERIWFNLYNEGINLFNEEVYDESEGYFLAAKKVKPEHFLTERMLGANYLLKADQEAAAGNIAAAQADTTAAVEALDAALTAFENKYYNGEDKEAMAVLRGGEEFKQDSSQLSYTIQQLAILYEYTGQSIKALEAIERGLAMAPTDKAVKRIELSIYQNNPELFEKAKGKFEAAIKEDPSDLNLKMAYAGLLERAGEFERAQELYQEAYDRDPDNLQANVGLGAFYINQAAELSAEKADFTDEEKVQKYDKKILGLLEKAYPYMKKLHQLQPEQREWLSQLVTITGNLGMNEEMEKYGKKLGELSN